MVQDSWNGRTDIHEKYTYQEFVGPPVGLGTI